MSYQWLYGKDCSRCHGPLGPKRCKGMCNACYYKNRRETDPRFFKEARRVDSPKKHWRSETYMGFTPSQTDWARLAAFIDGEGSIGLTPRKSAKSLTLCGRVYVTNTDIRLPNWITKTFGMQFFGKNSPSGRSPKWKGCFYSQATAYQACWILLNCLPWFIMKREQAEIVLAHQETMGSFVRASGVKTPENVLQYRLGLKTKINNLNRRGPKIAAISEEENAS